MNRDIARQQTYLPSVFEGYGQRSLDINLLARDLINQGYTLTLNEDYLKPEYKQYRREEIQAGYTPKSYTETPFNEIVNVPKAATTPEDILKPQKPLEGSFQDCIQEIKSAIKSYIVKVWNIDKPKVFLHSAGFDSRIVSGCLVELREERGEDWIGDIHFRCHQPEAEQFIEIMKREGWREDQYSLWEDVHTEEDHYQIGRLEPVNGFMSYIQQYNFFSDLVEGREKDVIIITGIYGGEMFDYPSRGKKLFTHFDYCQNKLFDQLHNYMLYEGGTCSKWFNDYNYAIMPYLSYDYLRVATRMPSKYIKRKKGVDVKHPDNIREALVKSFDFDIFNIPYCRHDYTWNVSKDTLKQMREFYFNSKFYEDYQIKIKIPFKNKSYYDMMWTLALMYDNAYSRL